MVIADGQALFRSGLARLLAADPRIDVVAEAADGDEAVRLAAKLRPDVVVMDVMLRNVNGIRATAQVRAHRPETRVLILTGIDGDGYIISALRAGAGGYMLKDADTESIIIGILAVNCGEQVVAAPVAERIVEMLTGDARATAYDGLTLREVEILRLVAGGAVNREIAESLNLSDKTVRNYVSRICDKLGIDDRGQAVLYAVRKGLVEM